MRISGRTQLAGIVGWPLDHTLSPAMHNAAYESMRLDWVYVPLAVPSEEDLFKVFGCLKALPFVGINVTMPYKQAALALCDEVAMQAQMAGAVNTVHNSDGRLIGYNTDGRGLLEALAAQAGFDAAGKRVTVVGAGGAAGSALVAMVLARAGSVTVLNRDPARAEALLARVAPYLKDTEAQALPLADERAEAAVRTADLVLNATPLGMRADDASPVDGRWLRPGQTVCDMVYSSHRTALLQAAEEAGAAPIDGLEMLVRQGAIAIDIWCQELCTAPREVMRAAVEEALRPVGRGVEAE